MDEPNVVSLYSGVVICNKKEQSTDTYNDMDDSQKYQLEQRSLTQKCSYYVIPFVWSSVTDNTNQWWKNFRTVIISGGEEKELPGRDKRKLPWVLILFYILVGV